MKRATKRKMAFLGGFAAYFGALWLLWGTPVVYPLKIFVVLLHETSHALAIWATGGTVERITLNAAQGGATYGYGGSAFLTLSAGYLGSLLWGVVLALSANLKRIRPNLVVGLLGGVVAGLTLLYVRSVFGVGFGVLFAVGLVAVAAKLPLVWNRGVLTVLGMTSCLYAILDIKSDVLDRPELHSDAYMLSELTGVHTLVWGTLWIVLALVVCFFLVRALWKKA